MKVVGRLATLATTLGAVVMLTLGPAWAQTSTPSASGDSGSASTGKVVFTIGTDSDVTSLNPYKLCCGPDYVYLHLIYDLGIAFNKADLTPAPELITSWTPDESSMNWTLKVRTDATWHDGTPVTADDIAFSFSLVADNQMPFYKDYLPFSPTFEVKDPETIIWHSTQPTFAPDVPPYIPIVPKSVWGKFVVPGDAKATRKAVREFPNDDPLGSGPFTLTEYKKGQFLRFDTYPDYWGGQPKAIQEIVLRVFSSQEGMAQALKSGEIDFAEGMKPNLFNSVKNQPGIGGNVATSGCWTNLAWNFGGQGPQSNPNAAIQDVKFRQAMSQAINRDDVVKKVFSGEATPGTSILLPNPNGRWVADIPENLRFDYDPQAAMQTLDAAGYVDTDGNGIRNAKGGGPDINLNLLVITDVDGSVETGQLVQGWFKDVGIQSHFTTVNTNKAYDLWYTGEWDAYLWDWCPDPDPDFMLSVFTTDQCLGWSDGCYSNKAYDKLYDMQRTQLDPNDRKQTIDKMQLMVAQEIPTMVIANEPDLQAFRSDRWTGWVREPDVEGGLYMWGWTNDQFFNLTRVGSEETSSPGLSGWVWVTAVSAAGIVLAGVLVFRRRHREEEI